MPIYRRRLMLLFALLVLSAAAGIVLTKRRPANDVSAVSPTNALKMLIAYEEQEARKHWGHELTAQKYTAFADMVWNSLNRQKEARLKNLALWTVAGHIARTEPKPLELPHGIRVQKAWGGSLEGIIDRAVQAGWELEACEIRHIAHRPATNWLKPVSVFYVAGHLVNTNTEIRAIVEGNIEVEWRGSRGRAAISLIDANDLEIRTRKGPRAFTSVLAKEVQPVQGSYFIDPLIVWDLDKDGNSEVILAARNLVLRRLETGAWSESPLLPETPPLLFTGMLGDFNQDQQTDFLAATFDGLLLYPGSGDGNFATLPQLAWAAEPRLRYAQTLTAGDIDADGDLDLFLGQYKTPFDKGQMPHPYFDANDGHPSFLLLNDGNGNFKDATTERGLAAKRHRRAYSSSFIDLDRDSDLDLVVVSDFSGLDAYRNDGKGQFTDATTDWFSHRHALGMAHSFADFNSDGLLDFLMIGMNSPTADRLESLGLARDRAPRSALTYGNRLFFGQPDGSFRQTDLSDAVARTGWSWGSAAADFDNDGFPDIYIANGHETKSSVEEYEPEFWLHDIYVGNSQENLLAHEYFQQKFRRTRGRGHSYGGHERNRFFLNLGGTNFIEVGHLFGISLTEDSRNVAATDLNNDGKLDLIVTTFEVHPRVRQTIQIFENRLEQTGNWLSIKFPDPRQIGQVGRVTTSRPQAFALPAGESYRTQLQPTLHLGLGPSTPPAVEITISRQTHTLTNSFNRAATMR